MEREEEEDGDQAGLFPVWSCVVLCQDDAVFLCCVGRQSLLDQNY